MPSRSLRYCGKRSKTVKPTTFKGISVNHGPAGVAAEAAPVFGRPFGDRQSLRWLPAVHSPPGPLWDRRRPSWTSNDAAAVRRRQLAAAAVQTHLRVLPGDPLQPLLQAARPRQRPHRDRGWAETGLQSAPALAWRDSRGSRRWWCLGLRRASAPLGGLASRRPPSGPPREPTHRMKDWKR